MRRRLSSNAAAAALGPASLITFESAPVGAFTSLAVAPGVTLTGANSQNNPQTINNTPNYPINPALDGFNTTLGGSNYLELMAGTATFTFSSPIQAFGAYITGPQPFFFLDTITFNDGTSQSVSIPSGNNTDGGVSFAGFVDPGKTITQITINAGIPLVAGDFIGVDDVRFVLSPAPMSTPEPGSLALLAGMGLSGAGFLARRRKNARLAA